MTNQNQPESGQLNYLTGVIDRLENKFAVIRTDDGQTLNWPIDKLPEATAEGEAIHLIISNFKSEEQEREKIAKAILNDILKTDEHASQPKLD